MTIDFIVAIIYCSAFRHLALLMSASQGYWRNVPIEAETQTPIANAVDDVGRKFPDALVTLPPKGWYRSQYRNDSGWGCGYRNAQTIFSALLDVPDFAQRLPNFVPSIPSIQLLIEAAWHNGFDNVGASQLGWELSGTKKWIGATELACLFAFLGIKCDVVDSAAPSGRTPSGKPVHKVVVDWVNNYMTGCIPFPIYFQFAGHSQTIVGCRSPDKGLFILDPSARTKKEVSFLPTQATNEQQYQLVAVTGIVDGRERDILKRTFNHRRIS